MSNFTTKQIVELLESTMKELNINELKELSTALFTSMLNLFATKFVNAQLMDEFVDFLATSFDSKSQDYRNGYYERKLNTGMGTLPLVVPRDRMGLYKETIFKKYQRSNNEFKELVESLFIEGKSTNEISETLLSRLNCKLSRETIRKIINDTLGEALEFNDRELEDCPFVYLDGTYIPIKRYYLNETKVQNECIMIALGITKSFKKKVLGFYFTANEGAIAWKSVLEDLKKRGLKNPKLFITDGLQGMPQAINSVFPFAKHQRCLVHVLRDILIDVHKPDRKAIISDFKTIYTDIDNVEEAHLMFNSFCEKWSITYPSIIRKLKNKENLFTYFEFPKPLWKILYTSNWIESFNRSLKKRMKHYLLQNSEGYAIINLAVCCDAYNKKYGIKTVPQFRNLSDKEKEELICSYSVNG